MGYAEVAEDTLGTGLWLGTGPEEEEVAIFVSYSFYTVCTVSPQ